MSWIFILDVFFFLFMGKNVNLINGEKCILGEFKYEIMKCVYYLCVYKFVEILL